MRKLHQVIETIDQQISQLQNMKQDLESLLNTDSVKTKEETISLEDVRAVLAQKSSDGLTKEVKVLIQSFGVNRLSEVNQNDYPILLEKAKELGHE